MLVLLRTLLLISAISLAFAVPAGAQKADELYEQGRFKEAMNRYNELDMEHPKDLRYRYNRGCAAYRAGDYQSAAAAFSSVVRRLDATEEAAGSRGALRAKAMYNLGNAAFQQEEYEAAVEYYKEALRWEETQGDARHNLELALRRLEDKKNREEEGAQKDKQGKPKDNHGEAEEGREGSEESDEGAPGKQEDQRENSEKAPETEQQKDDRHEPRPPEERDGGNEDSPEQRRGKDKDDEPEDLSGELSGPQDVTSEMEQAPRGDEGHGSTMNQEKAEALLDNVTEDRSRLLRFQIPEEKMEGVQSGKDW